MAAGESVSVLEAEDPAAPGTCWCCGRSFDEDSLVRLGRHPDVAVCLRCAHDLHQRAVAREDAARPTGAAQARDILRSGRRFVMNHQLQQKPVIGPVFRWMGRFMP